MSNPVLKTSRQLTSKLHKMGMPKDLEVVKGCGYFYFSGGNSMNWTTSSVYVYRLNDLTLEQWFYEYNSLAE